MDRIQDFIEISKKSKHVTIDFNKLKEFSKQLKSKDLKHWLVDAPFNIYNLNKYQRLHFLLVLNSISFCYWTIEKDKWMVDYNGKQYGGAKGMITSIGRAIEEGIPILNAYYLKDLKKEDLEYILRGNIEIPLFNERLNILKKLGSVLVDKYNGNFENFLEKKELDVNYLLEMLVIDFDFFNDAILYMNKNIKFYKRAQLLLSDIHEYITPLKDPKNILACADYKLPQVFRNEGIFKYSSFLENKINAKEVIIKNSVEEIELRVNTIIAVYELYLITEIDQRKINDYLWLMAQNPMLKLEKNIKYHRVVTINY
jgi:hypothetical protein